MWGNLLMNKLINARRSRRRQYVNHESYQVRVLKPAFCVARRLQCRIASSKWVGWFCERSRERFPIVDACRCLDPSRECFNEEPRCNAGQPL